MSKKKAKASQQPAHPSNADQEMRWVDAWNDLYEVLGSRDGPCRLPEGDLVDLETCQGYLQTSAYEGWNVKVEADELDGQPLAVVARWK